MHRRFFQLLFLAGWSFLAGWTPRAEALTLQPPRMVLNRSLFLTWDVYADAGFVSYEVFGSTTAGFTPGASNRLATLTNAELSYARIRSLSPLTRYYFRVRLNTTGGSTDSVEVNAQTLADGNETVIPGMMYHIVQPRAQFPTGYDPGGWMSTENFTRDLDYLKAHGVNCVGYQEILDRINSGVPLPPNPLFLTFDDAYVAYGQYAVPLLVAHDYQSVNAVVTRKTGGNNDWAIPEWPAMPLMTWTQIKECQRQGMWMGAHTQTHVNFYLEPTKLYEITGCRDDLIAQLQTHPRYFCYPWGMGGKHYQTAIDAVAAAGFTLATRTYPAGIATINSERLWFARQFANANDSLRDFLVKLNLDTDKDGLPNYLEMDWGTNDNAADGDGDGLTDYQEAAYDVNAAAYNPHHPTSNPAGKDLDANRADTDLDGLADGAEITLYRTDPLKADTDGDGLADGQEVSTYHSNPLLGDTDGDGMPDGVEVTRGSDPTVVDGRRLYPAAIPDWTAAVELENFDYGGAGLAYSDTTASNLGGVYRPFEGVDIAADTGASNGYTVGWTVPGEWLEYTVNVPADGNYTLTTRVAASGTGGQFRIEVNGTDKTGALTIPNTGAWNAYTLVTKTGVALTAGPQVLRVVMLANTTGGAVGAFDWSRITLEPPPAAQLAYPAGTPWPAPGTIECENFDLGGAGTAYADTTAGNAGGKYRTSDAVDISADAGAGNGSTVGWTTPGEWLEYTVNVATAGTYTIETRVAASGAGGQFRIEVNGADKTGTLAVPNTGAWNAYQIVKKTGVALDAGTQVIRLAMLANGSGGAVGAFDWIRVTAEAAPPSQSAYPAGTPWPAPGTIECENFDLGGAGTAYADTTTGNAGGKYRTGDAVDIAADAGAGNGHTVGWTVPGEWMEYTVNVATAGTYTLDTRVAGLGTGGQFRIAVDEVDVTGALAVPNTGAWNAYAVVAKTGVTLTAGTHVIRLTMVANASGGAVGAFDWIRFTLTAAPVSQSAYPAGTPWPAPGTIECENFDLGGAGTAYTDTTTGNAGGKYRTSEAVDIAADAGAGNGYTVGWTAPGEWLEYTVNVATAGTYTLDTRVAALGAGGQFRIAVDEVDVTGALAVPNTGAWNAYAVVAKTGVTLTAGTHVIRLTMVANASGGAVGAFDWIRFTLTAAATPAPAAVSTPAEAAPPPPTMAGQAVSGLADVRTSDEERQPGAGWATVDGDPATRWQGAPDAQGWWLVLAFEHTRQLSAVRVEWAEGRAGAARCFTSLDAATWTEFAPPAPGEAIALHYLWLVFPAGAPPPDVSEIVLTTAD